MAALHGDRLAALAGVSLPPAPDGAWSLATLGVHPDHRGAGLGTALALPASTPPPGGARPPSPSRRRTSATCGS
ncbi:GNAT family N-acetyltransferase [Nocardioides zeae]|uniref:GNAT family N-acetyltransferase n=1 Tax=Nocardioides zeae TaxID=1457234 RepID=UPI0019D655B3